ncbi:transcription termination factor Rho [Nocardioides sp. GBK3QG-3]|uniref:Transcription termination factor Rho n=2 Tax=Nocardioides mangrovi TaxID=2874580 RepID=A0ABS7U6Q5_9ACTN|nr:transcription termination factor Rho [Nocardioides mangrovi]MBZ5736575.1 transcription termination factor Rho [Nocardioides mangrovi]
MLLADLKSMAGGLGIPGAGSMKKAQLVEAIKAHQSGGGRPQQDQAKQDQPKQDRPKRDEPKRDEPKRDQPDQDGPKQDQPEQRSEPQQDRPQRDQQQDRQQRDRQQDRQQGGQRAKQDQKQGNQQANQQGKGGDQNKGQQQPQNKNDQKNDQKNDARNDPKGNQPADQQGDQQGDDDGDGEGSRRNRRRRGRDRSGRTGQRTEPDTTILEDDVLVPAAGILDVLDNYAFVRTSGYLAGADDVYVSLSMVRKYGLRRGDALVGQVRQPREGERKEKFNPMVRIDAVNGADPETAKHRVEFAKLTPLYPSERLRLETGPDNLIGRVIDIAAPIGKGQRGLIVSPAKAGKTMVMQSIANSITTNNPECHLMVVLVDERPEEVTDFERSVKGEVISSTFDRPASDHTTVAELAIERAKRLVELGHDVVVLLDGITRLGRAYNLSAPASGRILSGGVDSAALYPPKKFFGAARNIEDGGSLTILATALIESGSKMDEVIFEEFKGTGNMEIRLRRDFADKRLFPAIDAVQSGTRREELLMSQDELAIIWKLRRLLSSLDGQQALELLLERLKKSQTNIEFLMQVQKTTPTVPGRED